MLRVMAKVVDHDKRRMEVLDATWRVIARDGIDGASVRAIAHEVGWSTGVLAHYFVNKDEILQGALQLAHSRTMARAVERAATADGACAVFLALTESLPLDAERMVEIQVEIAFWSRALANKKLSDLQHREFDAWDAFVVGLVRGAADRKELKSSVAVDDLAAALLAAIDGIALEAALYPARVGPRRQLDALLTTLRPALVTRASAAVEAAAHDLLSELPGTH
jgi:AcrR family transcriptional regulator